jgi:hypothetical protein
LKKQLRKVVLALSLALGLTAVPAAAFANIDPGVTHYRVAAPSGNHCANPRAQSLGLPVSLGPCGRYYWILTRVRAGCDQLRNPNSRYALGQRRGAAILASPRDLHNTCFVVQDNYVDQADNRDELHYASAWLYWRVSGRGGVVSFSRGAHIPNTQWYFSPY